MAMLLVGRHHDDSDSDEDASMRAAREAAAAKKIQSVWRGQQERKYCAEKSSRSRPWGFYTHKLGLTYSSAAREATKGAPPIAAQLYLLLEDRRGGAGGRLLSVAMISVILASVVGFVLETMTGVYRRMPLFFAQLETTCTVIFSVEYVLRFAVCGHGGVTRCQFVCQTMNIFDLVAVLPFYVEWLLVLFGSDGRGSLRAFRVVRIVRILRLMKLGRYASGMRLMGRALVESVEAISVLVFLLGIGVTVFSSVLFSMEMLSCPDASLWGEREAARYAAECAEPFNRGLSPTYGLCCGPDGTPADFPSIVSSFWWSTVTMTSVGYGDVYPRTPLGRVVGILAMLVGMLLIALPAAIIGQKFQDVYEESDVEEAKLRAGARMRVATQVWSLLPASDVTNRLSRLKIRDPNLAEAVSDMAASLEQVWELREEVSRERMLWLRSQTAVHANLDRLLRDLGGTDEDEHAMDADEDDEAVEAVEEIPTGALVADEMAPD